MNKIINFLFLFFFCLLQPSISSNMYLLKPNKSQKKYRVKLWMKQRSKIFSNFDSKVTSYVGKFPGKYTVEYNGQGFINFHSDLKKWRVDVSHKRLKRQKPKPAPSIKYNYSGWFYDSFTNVKLYYNGFKFWAKNITNGRVFQAVIKDRRFSFKLPRGTYYFKFSGNAKKTMTFTKLIKKNQINQKVHVAGKNYVKLTLVLREKETFRPIKKPKGGYRLRLGKPFFGISYQTNLRKLNVHKFITYAPQNFLFHFNFEIYGYSKLSSTRYNFRSLTPQTLIFSFEYLKKHIYLNYDKKQNKFNDFKAHAININTYKRYNPIVFPKMSGYEFALPPGTYIFHVKDVTHNYHGVTFIRKIPNDISKETIYMSVKHFVNIKLLLMVRKEVFIKNTKGSIWIDKFPGQTKEVKNTHEVSFIFPQDSKVTFKFKLEAYRHVDLVKTLKSSETIKVYLEK